MSRFNTILPFILVHEGGKVDDPRDPGGRTNQGVTQRTFNSWLDSQGKSRRDVFSLTDFERNSIYRSLYWDVIQGDSLPAGVDLAIFDGAVNSGPRQSVKWLQRALGARYSGTIDGVIGHLTIVAIRDYPNVPALINAIMDRRLAFLQALSTFSVFGRGWTRRVKEVRADALKLHYGQATQPRETTNSDASAKGRIEDAKPIPTNSIPDATAATGASNVGIGAIVNQTKDALEPYVGLSNYIQWLVLALVITGAALAIGGIVWRQVSVKRAAKLVDDLNLLENPNGQNVRLA